MSKDQIMGLLRQVLPLVGGILVTFGWIKADQAATLMDAIITGAGVITTIGGILLSLKANSKTSILTAAGNMPEVEKVELKPTADGKALAVAVPSQKVDTRAAVH